MQPCTNDTRSQNKSVGTLEKQNKCTEKKIVQPLTLVHVATTVLHLQNVLERCLHCHRIFTVCHPLRSKLIDSILFDN